MILGHLLNATGKSNDSLAERVQNQAWHGDARLHRSTDVPWRVKIQTNGRTRLQRIHLWAWRLAMESEGHELKKRMGEDDSGSEARDTRRGPGTARQP